MVCEKNGKKIELETNCYIPPPILCGEWKLVNKGWLSSTTVCLITPPKTRKVITLIAENGRKLTEENENPLEVFINKLI